MDALREVATVNDGGMPLKVRPRWHGLPELQPMLSMRSTPRPREA